MARNKICPATGKLQFVKRLDAAIALFKARAEQRQGNDNRGECRYYLCPKCKKYHLTSKREWT